MNVPTFEEGLELLLEAATGCAKDESFGCTPDELAAAEQRLGRALPKVLRTFHARLGKLELVLSSHDRTVPLQELQLEEGGLTICREHQDRMWWVLRNADLDHDDPPVYQRQHGTQEWFKQEANLSLFLVTESAWQAVNGLPSTAVCALEVGTIKRLRGAMTLAAFEMSYSQTLYVDPERGILALVLIDPQKVYFGAHDDESLQELQVKIGIELDWL